MNWAYVFWGAMGWFTGVLTLMEMQVWKARQGRHHMMYQLKWEAPPDKEWDEAIEKELEVFIPTPRKAARVMQECPECGKAYLRVTQHMRMAHRPVIQAEEVTDDDA